MIDSFQHGVGLAIHSVLHGVDVAIDSLLHVLKSKTFLDQLKDMVPVLVGAVIGFAGSLFGSIIVSRRELVRSTRLRLYNDLIPGAEKEVNDFLEGGYADDVPVTKQMLNVRKAAQLTGRRDRKLAERALNQWFEARKLYGRAEQEGAMRDNAYATIDKLGTLSNRLGKKLT